MNILQLQSVGISIDGKRICNQLDLTLGQKQCMGILGRNGVGKTTLLHNIINLRQPDSGRICIQDRPTRDLSGKERARMAGMLFQESGSSLPATVLETVLLGRHPYADSLLWDRPDDLEFVYETIRQVGLVGLENRQLDTLSGGERQRVAIAMLLTQSPLLYLLDEPSNHLDIDSQIKLLSLIKSRVESSSGAMLMASHDINLTQRFCDSVLLMLGDGNLLTGACMDVLTPENLSLAYGCKIGMATHEAGRVFFPL
ncbi:MAG: ABC transporter ATP-binding protein [Pseudohongiellaceae bacterium]